MSPFEASSSLRVVHTSREASLVPKLALSPNADGQRAGDRPVTAGRGSLEGQAFLPWVHRWVS